MYVFESVPSAVLSRALTGIPKYLNAFVDFVEADSPEEEMKRTQAGGAVAHDQALIYFGDSGSGISFRGLQGLDAFLGRLFRGTQLGGAATRFGLLVGFSLCSVCRRALAGRRLGFA